MRYYIIVGEASGDLHGANLMKGLLKSDPQAEFRFWGGDKMTSVGGEANLVKHYNKTSFFGLTEIIKNLRTILSQINECKRDITDYRPDVLILIDYPGFNLQMAKFAHERGLKVFYYISPKVWAWKEGRVKNLKKYVDRLFIIFPFEIEYFRKKDIDAIYEGNPLLDSISQKCSVMQSREDFLRENGIEDRPVVALLAGSRNSEIKYNLPFMVSLSKHFPEYQFVLAAVPWIDEELYKRLLAGSDIKYLCDKTYEILRYSEAAVVTSGTATLETALIGTPELVCYNSDHLSVIVGQAFVKTRFISLVNLVMDKEVVRELVHRDMTMEKATEELRAILPGGCKREAMLNDFAALREIIGNEGASDRFASRMVDILRIGK